MNVTIQLGQGIGTVRTLPLIVVIVGKRVDKYKKRINEVRTTVPVDYDS